MARPPSISSAPAAPSAAQRVGSGAGRLMRAWRSLPPERRLAAFAAIGLFLTLFLPWYQETVVAAGPKPLEASISVTGWQAFSFVEAAVLLVAVGVLTLLFQRAEGRAFHLPGGDGWVITAAGFWTCLLVIWRIFDKQSVNVRGPGTTVSGIEWGIFVALGVAALLVYAGNRIRAAHTPEPPLPEELPPRPAAQRPSGPPPGSSGPPAGSSGPPARRAWTPPPVGAQPPRSVPPWLKHEREVGADPADHQDAGQDQRPGADQMPEHPDHQADHQHG
ncbi:MAG: hypothetical protein JO156_02190 [Solirubrobacterales bacterium]|nr:hypothetical protein [Solirubrobacterales bacterium]